MDLSAPPQISLSGLYQLRVREQARAGLNFILGWVLTVVWRWLLTRTWGRLLLAGLGWYVGYSLSELFSESELPKLYPWVFRSFLGLAALSFLKLIWTGYATGEKRALFFRPFWTEGVFCRVCLQLFFIGLLLTSVFPLMARPGGVDERREIGRKRNMELFIQCGHDLAFEEARLARDPNNHNLREHVQGIRETFEFHKETELKYARGL